MYFVNVLLFKFYFYIKNISLLYFYSFFLLHVFYTSSHQTTAGEVTGTQQRDGAAFFHVDGVFC